MTDKELLEVAARAAGIDYGWQHIYDDYEGCTADKWDWNPLTDDGDALRLANALRLSLEYTDHYVATNPAQTAPKHFAEPLTHGTNEAARRAIVRAAAEIGSLHNAGDKL